MKTKEEKKKSNLLFMLLVIFLISVILCILSFGIATWARYRSVTGSNVEAQIAKWSFKVNGEEEQFTDINLADTIAFEHVEKTTIAPGTYGSFDLDIDGRGSEVSLDYYINMEVAQKPTNMKFYLDSNYSQPIELAVGNKMFLEGDLLLSENPMQEIRTIYWKWDYRTVIMPSEAVLNAYSSVIPGLETLVNDYNSAVGNSGQQKEITMKINDKIDTQEAGGQVIVNVKVKGVQISPNFSLKRVQVTSSKGDVYEAGDTVNFSMEFTENVYGNNSTGAVTNVNAPVVTVGFGTATASNPIAKVASLMQTNLKLSEGEKIATFVSVNGNKINYSYTLQSGDSGAFRIVGITGSVYNSDGKQINFGTIQSVPEVMGGTVTTEAPVDVPIVVVTPTQSVTPISVDVSKYGQYVDIGTNLLDRNNITLADGNHPLADWRVFKAEENGTWLILADYLPQDKVPAITNLNKVANNVYCVNSSSDANLVGALENENEWKNLLENNNLRNNPNVRVRGAITVTEFLSSWNENENYGNVNSSSIGYANSLYYPRKVIVSDCLGCWFSSIPVSGHLDAINYDGNYYPTAYYDARFAVRPVVFLPSSLSFNTSGSVWTIAD